MTKLHKNIPLRNFIQQENGSATPLAIGFSVIFIVLGGLAVDYNKAVGERTQMQMAADSAAHAALYAWEFEDVDTSKNTAMNAINGVLPEIAFSDALLSSDIEFGFWEEAKFPNAGTFTVDPTFVEDKNDPRRSAVRVFAELEPERNNESRNIFLSIVGQDTLTIRASSVYSSYYPKCFREGFVADKVVDMQSNSLYLDGFCMHSNDYVSLNSNNYFETGTVVSMPDTSDLDIPESGFQQNEGLQAALRKGKYQMRILRQLPRMFQSLRNGNPEYAAMAGLDPDGDSQDVLWPLIKGPGVNSPYQEITQTQTGKKTFDPDDLSFPTKNRIYQANCSGNGDITFKTGIYTDFVLVTNCSINFQNGVVLDGVLIATEGDVSGSLFQLGLNDNCAPGGGAGIWTYGTFSVANGLQAYGTQILSLEDILFTAQANGIEGVSFIALGTIDGTSEGAVGYCDGLGTENFAEAPYFRMVN